MPYDEKAFELDNETSPGLIEGLGETESVKSSLIAELTQWINTHPYLSCRTDDDFLLKFLRGCKFDLDATKDKIMTWCTARSSRAYGVPQWFANQNPRDPKLRALLETGFIFIMPDLDDHGRLVLYLDMDRLQGVKLDPVDFIRTFLLVAEFGIFSYERCQVHGVIIIQNGSSNNIWILAYWTPDKIARAMNLKSGYPIRLKRIEYHNMNKIIRGVLNTAISLTSAEMQERMKFYSHYRDAVPMPSRCRPASLGGTAPEWEEVKDNFLERIEDFQIEFDSFRNCCVDEEILAESKRKTDQGCILM